MALGSLHHENNILFGPAMVDAYEIESSLATFPRIAVSDDIRNGLFKFVDQSKDSPVIKAAERSILRRDIDGVWFIDFLNPVGGSPPELFPETLPHQPGQIISRTSGEIFLRMGERIEAILSDRPTSDHRIAAKYDWLANYYQMTKHLRGII